MKKFEVGERVQVIYENELKTGAITNLYILDALVNFDSGGQKEACIPFAHIMKLDQPKQSEKVKKINEIMLELIHRKDMDILSDDDITQMLIEALDIVNTLDEPKPVVVPKETADFIKTYGSSNDSYSVLATIMKDIIDCYDPDTDDLFIENLDKNIQAVLNGYVVEEEPKYYVQVIPGEYGFLNCRRGSYSVNNKKENGSVKTKFTEKQIKAIDERLWAFAVPVEEVEAE